MRQLSAKTRPGHCSKCGGWLGEPHATSEEDLTGEAEVWAANAVGQLLTSSTKEEIAPTSAVSSLASLFRTEPRAVKAFPAMSVYNWTSGKYLPTLVQMLKISAIFHFQPLNIYTGQIGLGELPNLSRQIPKHTKRRRSSGQEARITSAVMEALADPQSAKSVEQVARECGVSAKSIRKLRPAESKQLSRRYWEARRLQRLQRERLFEEEVELAVGRLVSVGQYPSAMRVVAQVPRSSSLGRTTIFLRAWRSALEAHGIKRREIGRPAG